MGKLQSSIEFLLTYSWAFLAIAVFLAFILAVVTVRNPSGFTPSSCYISPSFPCVTSVFMSNSASSRFIVIFINNLGTQISFPNINGIVVNPTFSGQTYNGICLPYNAVKGAVVTCNVTISKSIASPGTQISPKFLLNYQVCQKPSCVFPISSANTINTTGFASMGISPQVANPILKVNLQTNPVPGQIVVDGVAYPSNTQIILLYQSPYTIYALPPSSYFFSSWSTQGGVSVISTTSQNTVMNTISPGNLIATFYSTTTTSTTTSTSTSTTTTSTTSTSTSTTSSTTSTSTSTTSTTAPLALDQYADSGLACCIPPTNPSTNVVKFTGITTAYSQELVLVMMQYTGEPLESVTDSQGLLSFTQYSSSVYPPGVYYAIVPNKLTSDNIIVTYGPLSGLIYYQVSVSTWSGENTVTPFDLNSLIPNTLSMSASAHSFNAYAYYNTNHANDILIAVTSPSHYTDKMTFPSGYSKITGTVTTGNILYVSYNIVSAKQVSANIPKTVIWYCPGLTGTCKYSASSVEPTTGGSDAWSAYAVAIQGLK
ncbi:MAG: hypothetical protein KGH52_00260 [Candidatus Micrarchaeota archaeon]|nr:hypothetical protein [Candidatus Micrarchaeota archaeon]